MTTISSQTPIPNPIAPAPSSPSPGEQQLSLGLQDLQNLLIVIDLACQRGAFKAPELSQIGAVFDRVSAFLQSTAPQQPEPQDTAAMPPLPTPQVMPQTMNPRPVSPMTPPPFAPKAGA